MASSRPNQSMLSLTHGNERRGASGPSSATTRKYVTRSVREPDPDRRRRWLIAAAGLVAVMILVPIVWRMLPPPQMKTDEQVFNTVDALFTALTSRDMSRLDDCERRFKAYQEEGRMSQAVATRLDAVVKQARDGKWEPAAKKLYEFIMGQRGKR